MGVVGVPTMPCPQAPYLDGCKIEHHSPAETLFGSFAEVLQEAVVFVLVCLRGVSLSMGSCFDADVQVF